MSVWIGRRRAHADGYRYVRSYHVTGGGWRWALWEQRHGKMRRVGTAHTEQDYRRFLGLGDTNLRERRSDGHDSQK